MPTPRRAAAALAALLLAASAAAQPETTAKAHILIDALTGKVLAEKKADDERRPASLAKLMTAYLTFEAIRDGKLSEQDKVVISPAASKAGGHTLRLRPGTELTVRELLLAMIHRSGNDAAVALAERLSGQTRFFVDAMNQRATELGMQATEFRNPTGLPERGAHSTARDLALLAMRLQQDFPQLYRLFAEGDFEIAGQFLGSRNPLLGQYKGADGLKTGHTYAAGFCLAGSAERSDRYGMRLFAVVLGAPTESQRNQDMRRLLDYGFGNYQSRELFQNTRAVIGEAKVWKGTVDRVDLKLDGAQLPLKLLLPRSQAESLTTELRVDEGLEAPMEAGSYAGLLVLYGDGKELKKIPVVTAETVAVGSWLKQATDTLRLLELPAIPGQEASQ